MSQKKPQSKPNTKQSESRADARNDRMFIIFFAVFLAAVVLVVGGVAIYSALQNGSPDASTSQSSSSTDGGEIDTEKFYTDTAFPDFRYTLNGNGTVSLAYYTGVCTSDTDIVIPEALGGYRVDGISSACFLRFALAGVAPRSLYIPKSVVRIENEVFGDIVNVTVTYEGSIDDWNAITVDREQNMWFQNATPSFENK